jgi:hypothetical protein
MRCTGIYAYMACRHCAVSSSIGGQQSYVEVLVYHSSINSSMVQVLGWVEEQADSGLFCFPGITVWCPACRRNSVVRYEHYSEVCRGDHLPESMVVSESVYYARMCMGAELLRDMQCEGILAGTVSE